MRTYLINNSDNDVFLLRSNFQKALIREGFIQEIDITEEDSVTIDGGENATGENHLQQVQIIGLNNINNIVKMWFVDLEKEISGLSTASKTPEAALLVLRQLSNEYTLRLDIVLIELKTTLREKKLNRKKNKLEPSTLQQNEDKFRDGMNRLYALLCLNDYQNPQQGLHEKRIYLRFIGVLCFNVNKIKNDDTQLFQLINSPHPKLLFDCQTLLHQRDKMQVHFIKNTSGNKNSFKVSLKDLLAE